MAATQNIDTLGPIGHFYLGVYKNVRGVLTSVRYCIYIYIYTDGRTDRQTDRKNIVSDFRVKYDRTCYLKVL